MSMEVKVGNILYIYKFVGAGGGGVGLGPDLLSRKRKAEQELSKVMGIQPKSESEAQDLKKLERVISSMLAKVNKLPSDKMKAMVLDMISQVISQASDGGDITGALNDALKVEEFENRAIKAGERITNSMGRLAMLQGLLPDSGKKAVGDLMKKAQAAVEVADTPDALEAIAGMLENATDTVNTMVGASENSAVYQAGMAILAQITSDLGDLANGAKTVVPNLEMQGRGGMAQDELALSFKSATDTIKDLKANTKDVGKAHQLNVLENIVGELEAMSKGLPPELASELQKEMNQLLSDAANGKLTEALQSAHALKNKLDQHVKLTQVVDVKLKLVASVANRLEGPTKDALVAVFQKAEAAKKNCKTPEDFQALEAMLLEAIKHAQVKPTSKAMHQGQVRQLQAIGRKLDAMAAEKPVGGAPQTGDQLSLGNGVKTAKTGRLGPAKTGKLPEDIPANDGKRDTWVREHHPHHEDLKVAAVDIDVVAVFAVEKAGHGEKAAQAEKPGQVGKAKSGRLTGKADAAGKANPAAKAVRAEKSGRQPESPRQAQQRVERRGANGPVDPASPAGQAAKARVAATQGPQPFPGRTQVVTQTTAAPKGAER